MSSYVFSSAQRFAIWKFYKQVCFWCHEQLSFSECEIDHVVPEHLEQKKVELEEAMRLYGLPEGFEVNNYGNWVPIHPRCNKSKSGRLFNIPLIAEKARRVYDEGHKVERMAKKILEDTAKEEFIAKVEVLLQSDGDVRGRLIALLGQPTPPDDQDYSIVKAAISYGLKISPRWKVVKFDENVADVTDGRSYGYTTTRVDADGSWMCGNCGHYGPWNGARCLECGMLSDD